MMNRRCFSNRWLKPRCSPKPISVQPRPDEEVKITDVKVMIPRHLGLEPD